MEKSTHGRNSVFPKSVSIALAQYNKILTDMNYVFPPHKYQGIINKKLPISKLATALTNLHPNWYVFGLPSDTVKEIFIKLESSNDMTGKKYNLLRRRYFEKMETCENHGNEPAIYNGLCADCAIKKLMEPFVSKKKGGLK
jgi:hypothetical protein